MQINKLGEIKNVYPSSIRENSFAKKYYNLKYEVNTYDPYNFVEDYANCEKLVHLYYREVLGKFLPINFRSKEIWESVEDEFEDISLESVKVGDILVCSRRIKKDGTIKILDFPHMSVVSNLTGSGVEVIHTNNVEGVTVSPVSLFFKRYPKEFCKIKRPKENIF
jgi:hypothetical protein